MHLPEFMLAAGRFRRLRRRFGARVRLKLRKMPKHETHAITKSIEKCLYRMVSLPTRRTFEITVLDNGDLGAYEASYMVTWVYPSSKGDHSR